MKVIIVGGGKLGAYLTSLLLNQGHEVKLIEVRLHQLENLEYDLPKSSLILGNGTDPVVLKGAGIGAADVLAAVTGADEINLMVAAIAREEYAVPRILARIKNPKNTWLFTPEMGVDVALNQAELMAALVEEELSLGDMMTLLKLNQGQFSLIEEKVHPFSPGVGKTIRELGLPTDCAIVAIIREGQLIIPHGSTRLMKEDEVLAIIHADELQELAKILGPKQ
jgi:trk system potassium uptake protein TrkA